MADTGPMNPHAYRPNEFVIQNLLYEGLVHYGPNGQLVPALAESWEISSAQDGTGETSITFFLRRYACPASSSVCCSELSRSVVV